MIKLTEADRYILSSQQGQAVALAMRILVRFCEHMGAGRLLDMESTLIGCLYRGQTSLDFVERLVHDGGR